MSEVKAGSGCLLSLSQRFLLFATMTIAATGCSERWEGFMYPDRNNLGQSVALGTFSSLDDCRARALAAIETLGHRNADYECGLNCSGRELGEPRICEQTAR